MGGRKPLGRHYPSQQFRVIRDAIGLPSDCVLHSTRHTFCTRLGNAGADAFTIQKLQATVRLSSVSGMCIPTAKPSSQQSGCLMR